MSNRGRGTRVYTEDALELLRKTTLTHSEIADVINERYPNVNIKGGTIGYLKRTNRIRRPKEDKFTTPTPKKKSEKPKTERKISTKASKKSRISNDNFIPYESIREVMRIAKIEAKKYKNKSLNECFQKHLSAVNRWLEEAK